MQGSEEIFDLNMNGSKVMCGDLYSIHIWDILSGTHTRIPGREYIVWHNYILVAYQNTIGVWSIATMTSVREWKLKKKTWIKSKSNIEGDIIIILEDDTMEVWDFETEKCKFVLKDIDYLIHTSKDFVITAKRLRFCEIGYKVWNRHNGTCIQTFNEANSVLYSWRGAFLFCSESRSSPVLIVNITTGEKMRLGTNIERDPFVDGWHIISGYSGRVFRPQCFSHGWNLGALCINQ